MNRRTNDFWTRIRRKGPTRFEWLAIIGFFVLETISSVVYYYFDSPRFRSIQEILFLSIIGLHMMYLSFIIVVYWVDYSYRSSKEVFDDSPRRSERSFDSTGRSGFVDTRFREGPEHGFRETGPED